MTAYRVKGRGLAGAAAGLVCLAGIAALPGCGWLSEQKKIDYRNTGERAAIEVPDDLKVPPALKKTAPPPATGTTTWSGYVKEQQSGGGTGSPGASPGKDGVLPVYSTIRLTKEGGERWLVSSEAPGALWPRIRQFFVDVGFALHAEDAPAGVMETDWRDRAVTVSDESWAGASKWLARFLGTDEKDRYRIRLERAAGTHETEIYVTQQAMEQKSMGGYGEGIQYRWVPRAPDKVIEAEMLQRLMAYLGGASGGGASGAGGGQGEDAAAQSAARAELLLSETEAALILRETSDRAWRRLGLTLDRSGFAVEDRDRSKGIFYIRYRDPDTRESGGFWPFSKGAPTGEAPLYQLKLSPQGRDSIVVVQDGTGQRDNGATARKILNLLHEQLK